jgi:sugar/nucleoside kinase (ribokinase family)
MRATSPKAEVLVTGLNLVDVLVRLPAHVQPGEKHEVADLVLQGGAPAGNAASLLASLGWRTGFIARMGENALSCVARQEFLRHGGLADYFIPDAEAVPGMALVEIHPASGERTVFYSLRGYRSLNAADIPVADVKQARLVLVDGYETAAAQTMLEAARDAGCHAVLDVEAGDPAVLRRLIELGTDIILPLGAAQRLSETREPAAVLRKLAAWTRGQLLVTDGRNGSWALAADDVLHQPAFPVRAVDTTGCGDAYHAAYASALLDGLPLDQRMEFASWVAAQVALAIGGRANLPTRQSIRESDLSRLSPALRAHLLQNS